MKAPRIRSQVYLASALGLLLCMPGLPSCSSQKEEAKHAQVKPGNMPEGGEWTGVYYSPLYGNLHLVKEGDSATGKWRTAAGDKWGELSGKVTGDLLRYEWNEHVIGAFGPSATSSGHGYFRYTVPAGDNVDHEIHGEWGLGSSDAGRKWDAIKQRNQRPDPDSVMPDETQTATTDSWDEKKKKAPAAESEGGESEPSGDDWE